MKSLNVQTYTLNPLGAGDLIDRAVRFYRQNFWTFIWIAAPPIVVGMLISVGWRMLGRELFSVGASRNADELFGYYLFCRVWQFDYLADRNDSGFDGDGRCVAQFCAPFDVWRADNLP